MNFSSVLRGSAVATILVTTAFTAANAQVSDQGNNTAPPPLLRKVGDAVIPVNKAQPPAPVNNAAPPPLLRKVGDAVVPVNKAQPPAPVNNAAPPPPLRKGGDAVVPVNPANNDQNVTFVANRKDLKGNDTVDWSLLGGPDPFTVLPPRVFVTSPKGLGLTVEVDTAALTATPPGVFKTGPEPLVSTAFANGDFLLLTGGGNPQVPGLENPSPVTITFDQPVFATGANLQPDDGCTATCPYTGIIQAFDKENRLIAAFSAPGTASRNLDDSATFYGVRSATANISKIVFSIDPTISGPHPISINALSLTMESGEGSNDK